MTQESPEQNNNPYQIVLNTLIFGALILGAAVFVLGVVGTLENHRDRQRLAAFHEDSRRFRADMEKQAIEERQKEERTMRAMLATDPAQLGYVVSTFPAAGTALGTVDDLGRQQITLSLSITDAGCSQLKKVTKYTLSPDIGSLNLLCTTQDGTEAVYEHVFIYAPAKEDITHLALETRNDLALFTPITPVER